MPNNDKPLVSNRFEALVHASVSPDLYCQYREWGWVNIPMYEGYVSFEDSGTQQFLDVVYETYGNYSGNQLEKLTHNETPWIRARNECGAYNYSRNPISLVDMKKYDGERIGKIYKSL